MGSPNMHERLAVGLLVVILLLLGSAVLPRFSLDAGTVSAFTGLVSALATVAAAGIALTAARSWLDGLTAQRADDVVSAIYKAHAAAQRLETMIGTNHDPTTGPLVDAAWDAWTEFRRAYAVARRYYPSMPGAWLMDGSAALKHLSDLSPTRAGDINMRRQQAAAPVKVFDDIRGQVDAWFDPTGSGAACVDSGRPSRAGR